MADGDDEVPAGFGGAAAVAVPPPKEGDDKEEKKGEVADEQADKLAAELEQGAKVDEGENAPDAPDLSLRLSNQLVNPETEIKSITQDAIYSSAQRFEDLPLSPELLQGLYSEMKFDHPSSIQASTLPMILQPDQQGQYRDLIAQAHNGSGKTTCFVLAMLSRVDPALQVPQALCMCPTRELVLQNLHVLRRMAKYTTIKAVSTADEGGGGGGPGGRRVARRAKLTEQVVIGTHGRCKNWVSCNQALRCCRLVLGRGRGMGDG
ncbi:hypothetical protein MNEG_14742 [Monoraphidium neglectum]|uniref:ATP-dependent RNA helicase n=1 Tax=Monoraphidium neglectum TaxID=145388 RepID=A0A0D2LUC8_9CHLO|nr:hypothetical protein MNEG_14742 [Monoraphidium neglectum]KIY93221.1 hypothetical protein MNEG_14742 [Monoraphidium neglectum]|eukprot:XP_013892241.1 hypothetical protein MNEG_14742 [Monoraphidium neglectum]